MLQIALAMVVFGLSMRVEQVSKIESKHLWLALIVFAWLVIGGGVIHNFSDILST